MTSQRPFRCDRCDWRGWSAVDPSREERLRTDSPPTRRPDLGDAAIHRAQQPRQLDLLLLDEAERGFEEEPESLKSQVSSLKSEI